MNRAQLQRLAQAKVDDALVLLAAGRWPTAYYVAGYAVEFALKACVLRHIDDTGRIFADADYLRSLSACWTHDFTKLVKLAGLEADFGRAHGANPTLKRYWDTAAGWTEASRYWETTTEADARELFEAITHDPDGVLTWIRTRW